MAARGRKTSDQTNIVPIGEKAGARRPPPPEHLSDAAKDEWTAVVGRMPPEWFPREMWGVLEQYCRHVVSARKIDELVQKAEGKGEVDVPEYITLMRLRERETKLITSLATKMRLTQQSTYDKSVKKPKPGSKPWETEEAH